MSSPAAEEESTDVDTGEEDQDLDEYEDYSESEEQDEEGLDLVDGGCDEEGSGEVRVAATAAEDQTLEGPTCCVCMEPWTCNGAHRICCIPCGHVYGRSCVEKWLNRCGNKSAKCPQCGARYKFQQITNLYAPGDLWDVGCCRLQVHYNRSRSAQEVALEEGLRKLEAKVCSVQEKMRQQEELYRIMEARFEYQCMWMKQVAQNVGSQLNMPTYRPPFPPQYSALPMYPSTYPPPTQSDQGEAPQTSGSH